MSEKDIGPLIKKVNDKLKAVADCSLKDSGLTYSQTIVMEFVHNQGGQTTQKKIEDHMQVSHPTVVGIVSRLEKNGFLECFANKGSGRSKIVRETEKALKTKSLMNDETSKMETQLTSGLSGEELSELRRMLNIICNNI